MAPSDWAAFASRHPVWQLAPPDTDRSATVALVASLAQLRPALDGDPWQDLDLAERMSARLLDLLPPGVAFSGDEAALLVLLPFLYDALWTRTAERERAVSPGDLTPSQDATSDRAAFERFAQTYS